MYKDLFGIFLLLGCWDVGMVLRSVRKGIGVYNLAEGEIAMKIILK